MPWIRIDENAMDHPKFVALSANAWRLWCEGQSYCQKHLTDGVIPRQVLKGFRYYSPTSLKLLTATLVPGKGPLWEGAGDGVLVHDYLDWNDSREIVMKARQEARDRRRRWRDGHASMQGSPSGDASHNGERTRLGTPTSQRGVVCSEGSSGGKSAREGGRALVGVAVPRLVEGEAASTEQAMRAGQFLERYRKLYEKHRKGAKYVGKEVFDYAEALTLVGTWDDERLDKLATVFLTTDHEFAERGSRTVAQFRSMASWCDSRLRESGL